MLERQTSIMKTSLQEGPDGLSSSSGQGEALFTRLSHHRCLRKLPSFDRLMESCRCSKRVQIAEAPSWEHMQEFQRHLGFGSGYQQDDFQHF
ncbi:8c3da5b9-42e3-450d-8d72-9338e276147c [Sclerotinia trifoliorum]|uniref:8c3da5b9-42e3-450d-8d72-9338e276147c n=1 Tax=Sclerotinia trifoliorum TaxID=28548 RepID=A0A8H2VND8_9HELO|nr:8c3da5b9-42e3-450d-8d72-9338e276147c [Sclerotinia trifoliorum]